MSYAELETADLTRANLHGALLRAANFTSTKLTGANLSAANAAFADFHFAAFDPIDVTDLEIIGATGLNTITLNSPSASTKLRKASKDLALKDESRELTSAIHKFQVNRASTSSRFFEDYVLGGRITDYGVYPWRSLIVLVGLIPFFALVYMLAFRSRSKANIWVVFYTDGVLEKKDRSVKLTNRYPFLPNNNQRRTLTKLLTKAWRILLLFLLALQFSLLTAFRVGWKELNVGSWIERLQARKYSLQSNGWVRRVAGLQSLLSVYLLALWLLTYFGNPFE